MQQVGEQQFAPWNPNELLAATASTKAASVAQAPPKKALVDVAKASQLIPPESIPRLLPTCPEAPAASTRAACITDASRKRGRGDDRMALVPTDHLRLLSAALQRAEESATSMVSNCVSIGLHFQSEASVFRAARSQIDDLIDPT